MFDVDEGLHETFAQELAPQLTDLVLQQVQHLQSVFFRCLQVIADIAHSFIPDLASPDLQYLQFGVSELHQALHQGSHLYGSDRLFSLVLDQSCITAQNLVASQRSSRRWGRAWMLIWSQRRLQRGRMRKVVSSSSKSTSLLLGGMIIILGIRFNQVFLKILPMALPLLLIATLIALLPAALALNIDPVNNSCIVDTEYSMEEVTSLQAILHSFVVNSFSQTFIELDLRHLSSIPNQTEHPNIPIFQFKVTICPRQQPFEEGELKVISNISADVNLFSFYTTTRTTLWMFFEIAEGYEAYKYLLQQSVAVKVVRENQRQPEQESTFVFMVNSLQNINLPYNRPNLTSEKVYQFEKIPATPTPSRILTTIETNNYWTTEQSLALPFIPYFSNCLGEGNHMYIAQLMEDPSNCSLVPISETKPINEFRFGSYPHSDSCKIERSCIYDQIPSVRSEFPSWQTLPVGTVLFSISRNMVDTKNYNIGMTLDDTDLVPCEINESKGTNSSVTFPLKVKMTLDYYQVTKTKKTMIACTISYSLYTASTSNFGYQLEIETIPLNHTNIMLAFGFDWYVYMIVFVLIGLISNLENFILWVFHSCVSRLNKKVFRLRIYLRVIWQIAKGAGMGLLFFIFLLFSVTMVMNGKVFTTYLYRGQLTPSEPRVFWDSLNSESIFDYSSQQAEQYRAGRMGISFLVVGSVIIFQTSGYFIGREKEKKEYEDFSVMGRRMRPREWNRGKFIFGTFLFVAIQFIFIYFAYSKMYSENIWTFIVLMKIIQIIMEEITKSVYGDLLPCLPLKVITDITAYMNTLSANNFYDFLFSFLIDVAINMIEKSYISQLQNIIVQKIQMKIQELERFYQNLINDTEGEVRDSASEDLDQVNDENTFVTINGLTEEVKFFDNQEAEPHNDDSSIVLNAPSIEPTQRLLREKLLCHYREMSENQHTNILNPVNNSHARPRASQQTGHQEADVESQSPSEKERESQQRSYIFEMLLDNIIMLFTFFLQPFVVLVFWITYDESQILQSYGITSSTVILYLLSAITIGAFTIINVILIFHVLECYIEINFEPTTTQLHTRFVNRRVFWKANDEDINKGIGGSLRGADHYCMSWQFFLLLTVYISSMILVMLGISILMNVEYNPLKDSVNILIAVFWYSFVTFFIWLIQAAGYKLNIDGWADLDGPSRSHNAIMDEESLKEDIECVNQRNSNPSEATNQGLLISSDNDLRHSTVGEKNRHKSKFAKVIPRPSQKLFSLVSRQSSLNELLESDVNESSFINSVLAEESATIKIATICRKLEKNFQNEKFMFDFLRLNKQYIKQNLDKILPLVSEMPELTDYYALASPLEELVSKNDNKNYDPSVLEIVNRWRNKCNLENQTRMGRGKQLEEELNACSFCFETSAIYHGFGGICLKCSNIFHSSHAKQKQT